MRMRPIPPAADTEIMKMPEKTSKIAAKSAAEIVWV